MARATSIRKTMLLILTGCAPALAGCGGEDEPPAPPAFNCTSPTPPPCTDALLLELNLQQEVAPGLITSFVENGVWRSTVDATAGGAFASSPDSYVYARFADEGLVKIEIDDETALEVIQWDIAFRRYVIRINSGDSGPGCTTAARLPPALAFESVSEPPADAIDRVDDFFTDAPSCEFINEGSGLPGSPATALSGYWSYPGCVQMTYAVYLLELRDRRHVKLQVTHYYNDANQPICQETPGSFDQMGATGAATIQLRWAFVD